MKKTAKLSICTVVVALLACLLCACSPLDKKYFEKVSAFSFWDNKASESLPQYQLFNYMSDFLSSGTIENGNSVDEATGKTKKVLYVGWDGTRADAMANLIHDSNASNAAGNNYEIANSGIRKLKEQGGLYLAFAGGEKDKDSAQTTSTCSGWTSALTGGWNTLHGVKTNDDIKNAAAETIMMQYAKKGLNTSLGFDWGQYFDTTLQNEVKFMLENKDVAARMNYLDINRPKAASNADILKNEGLKNEKNIRAVNLDYYNAVAVEEGKMHAQANHDVAMKDYILGRIAANDDFVGGLFHGPDDNGHGTGYGNDKGNYVTSIFHSDAYLYQILEVISEREANFNEDWLVVASTDHGGIERGHGQQVFECRTIWAASNKQIDAKYFAKNYDGYQINE